MQAVILAAGFSTRLYPRTEFFPKGLLKIGGKAITEYLLDDLLSTQEIKQIFLVTNHRYLPHFQDFLNSNPKYSKIKLIDDGTTNPDNRLGALGDLLFIKNQGLLKSDVLVCPSDTISSVKVGQLIESFKKIKQFTTTVYNLKDKTKISNKLGSAVVKNGRVVEFEEKPEHPKSTMVGVPFYIYPKEILAKLSEYEAEGNSMDAPGSIIEWLLKQGVEVVAHQVEGYYYDVGTIDIYQQLSKNPNFLNQ